MLKAVLHDPATDRVSVETLAEDATGFVRSSRRSGCFPNTFAAEIHAEIRRC